MTGLTCAFGLVAGVLGARRTGRGMDVDTSLFDTALQNLSYLETWFLNGGHAQGREPRSAHPSLTPSQLYRTQDGWIFLMCNKEKFWPILAERIGRPELANDRRFARFDGRLANRAALTEELDAALMRRTTAEWLACFAGVVPAAPVYDVGQALDNRFVRDTGRIAAFERAEGGAPVAMLAGPIRLDGATTPARAAPALGADTASVLSRAGVAPDELPALRARGVI